MSPTSEDRFSAMAVRCLSMGADKPTDTERSLREMIDALPAPIYTTDGEGRLTYFNPAARELTGHSPELQTTRWCISWKLYRPDGTPLPLEESPMAVALRERRPVRGSEMIVERPDGTRLWVMPYPSPILDGQGRVTGGVNMLVDITERRHAEELQARLAAIVDSSDDAIVGKTLDGIITSWNQGAERIFGYSAAEAVGQSIYLIVPRERREEEEGVLARLRRGQRIDHFETERQTKDGRRIQISLAVSPIRDSSGRVIGAAKVARDMTDAKRAEQEFRHAQKLDSIGVLTGGIAHDFNNLLTGVLGNASLALDLLPPNDPARSLLHEVVRAGQSAAHLTQQMLAYSGKGQLQLKCVDLSKVVRDTAALLQSSIPRAVRLQLELDDRLPAIDGDPERLRQMLTSLMTNGAEAIGENRGGTLRVSTGLLNVDEICLRQDWQPKIGPGRYVWLRVEDSGCGMDENTRARIFDPFFTTKFLGRGLGLAAALGIVRGHRGAIRVSSTPGEGSVFHVLLPLAEDAVEEPPPTAREVAEVAAKGVILVVDDEETVRRTAAATLQRYGYGVLLAENGRDAVELFRPLPDMISLVLLDMTMPVLSGEQTLQRLQAIRPDIPVILTSGYSQTEALRRFEGRKLAGFLQKPYTPAELAEKIQDAFA